MAKFDIFTTSVYYRTPKNRNNREYILHSYESLNDTYKEWILENYIRMIENPTQFEQMFEQYLKKWNVIYEKQVFFRINGSAYFLDFYIPSKNIAIEIDGKYHDTQKLYDAKRNKDFRAIGIGTIRIKNKDVVKINVNQKALWM